MSESEDKIYKGLLDKIKETEELILECSGLPIISGKAKLQRKIAAELRFLKKLMKNPLQLKEEHIRSSNIYHLSAVVQCCKETTGVIKVLETVSYIIEEKDEEFDIPIVIDVVADYGATWVKVATRNPHHLYQACVGHGKYGRRSIFEQVEEMIVCAAQNPHMFSPPNITVRLAAGITKELQDLLHQLNITVIGDLITDDDCSGPSLVENNHNQLCTDPQAFNDAKVCAIETDVDKPHFEQCSNLQIDRTDAESGQIKNVAEHSLGSQLLETVDETNFSSLRSLPVNKVLNLDVSTCLAYVSNMTNGHWNEKYNEKLLMELAEMERKKHVKPILDELFKGRDLVCCETAHKDFLEILSTVGGVAEKRRAQDFLHQILVVPDEPSDKSLSLEETSKIKARAKIVFGTGDSLKAITVSANLGFLRAAQSQGMKFVAFIHESRALTESKELRGIQSEAN